MTLDELILDVEEARQRFLNAVGEPSRADAACRPAPDCWCITEIVEHMTLAEQVGVNGMWKALEGHQRGQPVWSGEPIHRGKSIEEVVARTWKEREQVPAVAAPRWGGPLGYWTAALRGCQPVLAQLQKALEGVDLEQIIYPHPISGPLDARQRLAFLRFHLDRHRDQVLRVLAANATQGTR